MLFGFHRSTFPRSTWALALVGSLSTLATLLPVTAQAQPLIAGIPSVTQGSGVLNVGTAPIRVWHNTRAYGMENGQTAIGSRLAMPTEFGLAFIDGQLRSGNIDRELSGNAAIGARWFDDGEFGFQNIWGASVWYDGQDTRLNNWYDQVGVSLERLGPRVDFRLNAYFPTQTLQLSDQVTVGTTPVYSQNILGVETMTRADRSLRIIDFEVAPRLGSLNLWLYGGGYQMDGGGESDLGSKGGVRGYVTNDLVVDVGVTDDKFFGTNTVFQIIWTPGRTASGVSSWSHDMHDRLREQVYRNMYVATRQVVVDGVQALTDLNGDEIRVVHVDSAAAAGGDGTFENPLNNLDNILANSQQGDIILAHGGSVFNGQSATLQDEQRFLGEGGNETHQVTTSELGVIDLPETHVGGLADAIPIIMNAPGAGAIILAGGNTEVESLAGIEISNLHIDGGTSGIVSPTGVGAVDINRMLIENTTGDGINLTPLEETLVSSATRARLAPTIDEVVFNNVGGDDIHITGTTTETTNSGTIAISNITSTDGNGTGVVIEDARRATTITDMNWDGGTTGVGALLVKDAPTGSNVTMTGTNVITGGTSADTETQGYAVRLENSAGTHNLSGVTVTDTGGDTFQVAGGTANMNFTGSVTQGNNASVLQVDDFNGNMIGHTGTLTFTEATADAGVILATNGDGLQFLDADGVYTFNDKVNLNGGDAGIDIGADSEGSISLADGEIHNPSGVAVNVAGGSANLTYTGLIEQTAFNSAVVNVNGGHTGTLQFNELTDADGSINATMGPGLVFDDADGTYNFNGTVELNGAGAADTGIKVLNTSTNNNEGTFTFADTNITNPTGTAVVINGLDTASATFTFTGDIMTDASRPVEIADNTGGSITFSAASTINSSGLGILIQNNTDMTDRFAGEVVLDIDTAAAIGLQVDGNTNGSTRFDDVMITTTTGDAVSITGNTDHNVTYTGDITTSGARPIDITGNNGGTMVFSSTGTVTSTGDGIRVDGNTDVTTQILGAGTLTTGANQAVLVNNNTNNSTTISNIDVVTTTGDAVTVTNNTDHNVTFGGDVTTTGANPAVVTGNTNGTITFSNTGVMTSNAGGQGIIVQLNDGTTTQFAGAVTLDTGATTGVLIDQNTNGSTTFSNADVTTAGADAFEISANEGHTLNHIGDINTSGAGRPVNIHDNLSGTSITFASTGTITGTGLGIRSEDNTGTTTLFAGAVDLQTTTNDAVLIDNNTNGSTQFNNIDIKTTTGRGFTALGNASHSVAVLNNGNTIETTIGTGLTLNDVTVGASGVRFDKVTVDGAVNGINLTNLTGGAVTIGAQGSAVGDGGSLANTTNDAVLITNAANVSLNHINIDNAGNGAGSFNGISYNVTTAAASRLTLNGNSVSNSSGDSIEMLINGTATTANVTIENNNVTNTSGNTALFVNTTGVSNKTVNFLMQGNTMANDSGANPTVDISVGSSTLFNANVLNNPSIANANAAPGTPFAMVTNSGSAVARLNLNGNNGTASSGNAFFLTETSGTFTVEDLANVNTNNNGGVTTSAGVSNDPGNIPTP